ncbi:tetratricopeptide (TPR) repeat protein [Stakelama sediminis]|uniref:Tetratricopeptide (TPR) repeat protein n=2 Tax=Stakelama sediminis TaxID=463200 RepID=A0A840YZE7_9SPHN|nr:tetratricopeptide (TPR) repeat protein [Stakelama sediminis]
MAIAGAVAATVTLAGQAFAETATQDGYFAAPDREASYLQRLAIDGFDGKAGPELEDAITRALMASGHFDVMTATRRAFRNGDAQGLLSGTILTSVNRSRFRDTRETCVERKDGDCVKHERKKVDCLRRTATVRASLQIERTADSRIVYSQQIPQSTTLSWCPGDRHEESIDTVMMRMIGQIAGQFAADITPEHKRYAIRFRESRKDMPKEIGKQFKEAVHMTKRDVDAACQSWQALDAQLPDNASITFDLGLCAEHKGDYQGALAKYERASQLIGGSNNEGDEGVARIHRLIAGREDQRRFAQDGAM